jgi:hypothetical protein
MTRALLDANAFNELVEPDGEAERIRLEAAVARGGIQVVVTAPLMEELCAAHHGNPQKAMRMVDLAFDTSRGCFLYPMRERWRLELTHRRKLTFEEAYAYLPVEIRTDRAAFEHWVVVVNGESAHHRSPTFLAQEKQLNAQLDAVQAAAKARGEKFPGLTDEQVIGIVQKHAPALARGYARHQANVMGLPQTTVEEIDPTALPSMFRLASFIYARKNRERYQSAGFNKGELYDQLHFTDAAYADLIVSADQRFHDTVAITGIPMTIVKRSDARWMALLDA